LSYDSEGVKNYRPTPYWRGDRSDQTVPAGRSRPFDLDIEKQPPSSIVSQ